MPKRPVTMVRNTHLRNLVVIGLELDPVVESRIVKPVAEKTEADEVLVHVPAKRDGGSLYQG